MRSQSMRKRLLLVTALVCLLASATLIVAVDIESLRESLGIVLDTMDLIEIELQPLETQLQEVETELEWINTEYLRVGAAYAEYSTNLTQVATFVQRVV